MRTVKYKKIEIIQGIEPQGVRYFANDYCFKSLQDAKTYIDLIKK